MKLLELSSHQSFGFTELQNQKSSGSISFIIPVKDEQSTVFEIYDSVVASTPASYGYEVIFIDDGSDDDSWAKIVALASLDDSVRGLRFGANAGKAKAVLAGISAASGKIIFTMDAHLPEASRETVRFLEKLDDGYDLVSGCHTSPAICWHRAIRRWTSNQFLRTTSRVKLRDYRCGLKCFRAGVAKTLLLEIVGKSAFGKSAEAAQPNVAEISLDHAVRRRPRHQKMLSSFTDVFTLGRVHRLLQQPARAIHPLTCTYSLAAGLLFTASNSAPAIASDRLEMRLAALICALLASLALCSEFTGTFLSRRLCPSLRLPVVQDTVDSAIRPTVRRVVSSPGDSQSRSRSSKSYGGRNPLCP